MELTAKSLSDLVRSLRSGDDGTLRRKQPRVGLRIRTEVIRVADIGVKTPASVRDVSAGGVSFTCGVELRDGESIKLMLPGEAPGADDEMISCTVAHCRRINSGLFVVGAKFDSSFR